MFQKFSCGNAVPTQFLMLERRSHAFPPHYTTAHLNDFKGRSAKHGGLSPLLNTGDTTILYE